MIRNSEALWPNPARSHWVWVALLLGHCFRGIPTKAVDAPMKADSAGVLKSWDEIDLESQGKCLLTDRTARAAERYFLIAICFSGKSSAARLVPITGTTPGASAYLFSNQNTTATMISASMIRSTHNGNFTPHPFLGAGTPIMFSVTGRAAG